MNLKYPREAGGDDMDYVTFTPLPYRANNVATGSFAREGTSRPAPAAGAHTVTLYMPNSSPPVGNTQSWGEARMFVGPSGQLARIVTGKHYLRDKEEE